MFLEGALHLVNSQQDLPHWHSLREELQIGLLRLPDQPGNIELCAELRRLDRRGRYLSSRSPALRVASSLFQGNSAFALWA
jgi:hypothetical protein